MALAFNTILIPVDFSLNTELALRKAIGLVGADASVIHLLHVAKPGRKALSQFKSLIVERNLEQLKENIQHEYPAIRVRTHLRKGYSVQETITGCAATLNPDLIIIGKQ